MGDGHMYAGRGCDQRGGEGHGVVGVELLCSRSARLKGLLGRKEREAAVLLAPCNDVHTFGMKRDIDIAFLSGDGTVVSAAKRVGSRRRLRCRKAVATLERLSEDSSWFSAGDRVEITVKKADSAC